MSSRKPWLAPNCGLRFAGIANMHPLHGSAERLACAAEQCFDLRDSEMMTKPNHLDHEGSLEKDDITQHAESYLQQRATPHAVLHYTFKHLLFASENTFTRKQTWPPKCLLNSTSE
jgi:hypothetical protein